MVSLWVAKIKVNVITVTIISISEAKNFNAWERVRKPTQWTCHFSSIEKNNQRMKITGHIPDDWAKAADGVIPEWKDLPVIKKTGVKNWIPPEGPRVPGGGIEIPSIYILHGTKVHKR